MKMEVRSLSALLLLVLPCAMFARSLKPEVEHAMAHGAKAMICLKICDDTGAPVSNASVRAEFDMLPTPHSVYGKTDTNGVCVVTGKTNGNKVVFSVGKEGYYGSRKEMSYVPMGGEHDVKDGKWQPYGAEEVIELRKIRNPAHLAVSHMREFIYTRTVNAWVGFDLERRDFVRPYGNGEAADFEVFFEWDGKCFADYKGLALKIRFADKFSGYYQREVNAYSEFRGPYAALIGESYMQSAGFFERVIIEDSTYGRRYDRHFFNQEKCWIVRSRCKIDANGNLISAHYSVVNNIEFGYERGGVAGLCITGAFNPTPNDTNLEDIETAERSRGFLRQCEPPSEPKKKPRKWLPW